jgi:hypothetical protein
MLEVVVFTAMAVALSGYVLGLALCRAAAQRDAGGESVAIEVHPYSVGTPVTRPPRATRRPGRCSVRH